MFKGDKESFEVYHKGFQGQVSRWPVNPLSTIVQQLKNKPTCKVIADFGCGDAQLAESLPQKTIHSFDLVALKPCVTVCDMSKVPLPKASVDAAVFCLSLMGTNLADYLCEANRVLKIGGMLLVAEVVSRFQGIVSFIEKVEQLGFSIIKRL
ncbi:ribosomal RNA-processing protein 8-like [Pomacea canaliculata]|uniref:ribosomal RNA-processing protein 8-like n=1 Tax=Pomacea canaliculata TaxID=400727 RepID=UPI000D73A877|nr:ribosomal RNA-processing protein 8-like [Pomacea canaliculata]